MSSVPGLTIDQVPVNAPPMNGEKANEWSALMVNVPDQPFGLEDPYQTPTRDAPCSPVSVDCAALSCPWVELSYDCDALSWLCVEWS